METSDVNRKSDSSFELQKISDWAPFSGNFQMAMMEAKSASKRRDSRDLIQGVKIPPNNVPNQKLAVKSVRWNLPKQPIGNFGKKLININRATFATNIQVTSSLPRAKLLFPLIRKPPAPEVKTVDEIPEKTIVFIDSEQFSKELRPRSAHELSHERANRLRREELEKCRGKYCNRLDVKFRRKPSPKCAEHSSAEINYNNGRKLPVIICQDSPFIENSKDASHLTDSKCSNWLHTYCKYFK